MTTDDDRVAYLAGEAEADVDDVTRADLDELRDLLADPAVWAEPGPGLEDAIVAAITAEAAAGPVVAPPAVARTARRHTHRLRNVLTAAAAVAVLGVGGFVVVSRGDDDGTTEFSLGPGEILPEASGTAEIRQTESGWRIELDATGLPRLDDGRFYQAWLKSPDGVSVPVGTFNEPLDVVLWAGVSPVRFSTLTVTEEEADGDQASSGRLVLVGTIELDES
jgi:Anti-sigma-K factor rskA, C-terminal